MHGYASTAQCFDTLLLSRRALRLRGALEWPTKGLTGASDEQKKKRQHHKDHDSCRALINGALRTDDCCTLLCWLLLHAVSQNEERSRVKAAAQRGTRGSRTMPLLRGEE